MLVILKRGIIDVDIMESGRCVFVRLVVLRSPNIVKVRRVCLRSVRIPIICRRLTASYAVIVGSRG